MKLRAKIVLAISAGLLSLSPSSLVAGPQFYLGGAYGLVEAREFNGQFFNDSTLGQTQDDREDTGYRAFGGLGFSRFFSIELGYANLGETKFSAQSSGSPPPGCCYFPIYQAGPVSGGIELDGIDFSMTGRWPLPGRAAMGLRLGLFRWTLEPNVRDSSGPINRPNEKGTDFLAGLNIMIPIAAAMAVSLDYLNYAIQSDNTDPSRNPRVDNYDSSLLSLGLVYTFGR